MLFNESHCTKALTDGFVLILSSFWFYDLPISDNMHRFDGALIEARSHRRLHVDSGWT